MSFEKTTHSNRNQLHIERIDGCSGMKKEEYVDDVLVGSPTSDEITDSLNLFGKKIVYMLGIPKGDTHTWEDAEVIIWGNRYRTFGYPITGEQANIPLRWGQNVRVERYG